MARTPNILLSLLCNWVFLSEILLPVSGAYLEHPARHHKPAPVCLPTSNNPNITYLPPQFFSHLGSQRVKIKYGPFTAPSNTVDNGMETFEVDNATMPCTDCLITWMQAGLEYPDGSYANADTGMWLHHVVVANTAQRDAVCYEYAPDRFFASGNERTEINLCVNGTKNVGYYLPANASLAVAPELMNETPQPRPVIVTLTFEFIPSMPRHFKPVTPVWLDVGGVCGSSDQPVPANQTMFSLEMNPPWVANVSGPIAFIGNHIHDGGLDLQVTKDGKTICQGNATYGATPGYIETNSTMSMGMNSTDGMGMDMVHISNISTCAEGLGNMKIGQKWSVKANYDLMQHPPMVDADGMPSPVMGIALVYVAGEEGKHR